MNSRLSITLLTTVLLMAACAPATPVEPTPDVQVIRTSAANTVVAEFTLTAAAFTPTFLPSTETPTQSIPPTETPTLTLASNSTQVALGTPAALCDDYSFDLATLDVTIPDGTPMAAGQDFVKTWRIKNIGICSWDTDYKALFAYSDPPNQRMDGQPIPLTALVAPGAEVEISVQFKAPSTPGIYTSYWTMVNSKGIEFGGRGKYLSVKIVVQ